MELVVVFVGDEERGDVESDLFVVGEMAIIPGVVISGSVVVGCSVVVVIGDVDGGGDWMSFY